MSDEPIEESGNDSGGSGGTSAQLVVVRGGQPSGERFTIGATATIGRFDPAVGPVDVDLGPTPEGVYVSRRHAEIRNDGDRWLLKDLGSSNGTFVLVEGGEFARIDGEVEINSGQQISFGNARFVFESTCEDGANDAGQNGDEESKDESRDNDGGEEAENDKDDESDDD